MARSTRQNSRILGFFRIRCLMPIPGVTWNFEFWRFEQLVTLGFRLTCVQVVVTLGKVAFRCFLRNLHKPDNWIWSYLYLGIYFNNAPRQGVSNLDVYEISTYLNFLQIMPENDNARPEQTRHHNKYNTLLLS
jgi:hypothetical protein